MLRSIFMTTLPGQKPKLTFLLTSRASTIVPVGIPLWGISPQKVLSDGIMITCLNLPSTFSVKTSKQNQGRKAKSWRPRQKEGAQGNQAGSWRAGFPTGRGLGHPCGLRLRGILPPPQEPPRPCSSGVATAHKNLS